MKDPVLSRRSIRKYVKGNIENGIMDHLLAGGDSAACAKGLRSWHFIVITRREILDRIPDLHPYSRMVLEAPAAIVVCSIPSVEPIEGYRVQNCSAATQNILVAANSRGIGSVWLGVYPRKERMAGIGKLLDLPDDLEPFSIVVLGYPGEKKDPYTGFEPSRVSRMD